MMPPPSGASATGGQTPHAHSQAPWSIKGIAPHMREAVKDAARRSGMTIGEWLSAAIAQQSETAPEPQPPRDTPADARWAEITAHLARLARRDAASSAAGPQPGTSLNGVSPQVIGQLLREAEIRAVQREKARAAHIAEALTGLARYIDNAERIRSEEMRRAASGQAQITQELSDALATIAQQVKDIDERLAELPGDTLAGIQDAVDRTAAVQTELLTTHLLPAMEQRLAAALRDIVESLQAPDTRAAASPAPAPAGTASAAQPAPVDEQLIVEDRLARAIFDIRTRQVELARLDAQAEGDGQHAIIERLENLSRKLDDALRPVAGDTSAPGFETVLERLDHISSRLEDGRFPPALSRVEDMVRDLSGHVEALHKRETPADSGMNEAALDTLAAQISQLAQRLEDLSRSGAGRDSEADPEDRARLQQLETAVGTLSLQLRDLPQADQATLERVARAAARETLGAISPDDILPGARSADTLDAVHSTLERIVDRLALIEEDIRSSGIASQQFGRETDDGDAPPPRAASSHERIQHPELRAAQALSRAFSTTDSAEAPAAAVDGPENLLAPGGAGLTENVGFTAGFIAAARRAAMAAADETRNKSAAPRTNDSNADSEDRRRSLLIGLGGLIAATGAAQVAATVMQGATRLS